jgi:hypothetical protein
MKRTLLVSVVVVLTVAIGGWLMAGSQILGDRSGTEEPAYTVQARLGEAMEIRRYGERVAVETDMGDGGGRPFMRLYDYITGANTGTRKIAMTVPVAMEPEEGATIAMTTPVEMASKPGQARFIRFMLPADYTIDTAPEPTNPRVRLVALPAQDVAVRRFSGWRSTPSERRNTRLLRDRLAHSDWRPSGPPVTWVYDPIWTVPFLRRNEIAIPVESASAANDATDAAGKVSAGQ